MSSKPPKNITLHPTSSIHPLTTLTGTHPLTVASHTYIHLRAILNTTHAPVTIGENCIICEKAVVGLTDEENQEGNSPTKGGRGVALSNFVVIECKAIIEGTSIGEGTVVEAGAKVGKGAVVGKVWFGPIEYTTMR